MFVFLFDILPDVGHIRFTLRLAYMLHERGHEVYYTNTSDSAFTSELIRKGIGRVVYPDDLRWFAPDLVLLDYQLRYKALVYEKSKLRYIYVTMQLLSDCAVQDDAIPVLHLPPTDQSLIVSSFRHETLSGMLALLKQQRQQVIIVGLMEEASDDDTWRHFYEVIKSSCMDNPEYHVLLLTDSQEAVGRLFPLPDNVTIYRLLDLPAVLPLCDVALTTGGLNTLIECIHAHLPSLVYSTNETAEHRQSQQYVKQGLGLCAEVCRITPKIFGQQIEEVLRQKELIEERTKQVGEWFEIENKQLDRVVEQLENIIQQNKR